MPFPRPPLRSRLGLLAVGAATAFIAACDTSSSFSPDDRLWSFVTINALRNDAGEHRTAPTAYFFRGAVSSIPNAAIKPDSCFPIEPFVAPTPGFGNVTYLDAGAAVTTTIGGVATELPRVQASGTLSYNLGLGQTDNRSAYLDQRVRFRALIDRRLEGRIELGPAIGITARVLGDSTYI